MNKTKCETVSKGGFCSRKTTYTEINVDFFNVHIYEKQHGPHVLDPWFLAFQSIWSQTDDCLVFADWDYLIEYTALVFQPRVASFSST